MVNGDVDGGAQSDLSAGGQRLSERSEGCGVGAAGTAADNQVDYDAGKQVKGRKIHALVDTEGLPMRVVVHSAAIRDRDGAGLVLDKIPGRFPWLELIWADGVYNAWQVDAAVAKVPPLRMEIVKRSDEIKGFVVLPRRWVVERTFSWFGRNRRLAKDFENLAATLANLRYPRLDPTGPQAARQSLGRDDEGLQSMDSRPSTMPGPAAESRRKRTSI